MNEAKPATYRRRVGTVRPSHLMFTGGVGALIDLPNFSVLVGGLDDWRYDQIPEHEPLTEPRLLAAAQALLGKGLTELRDAPWLTDDDRDNSPAKRIGVPVAAFPQWLRCTACNQLAPLDSEVWSFENDQARRPDKARFYHPNCRRGKKPLAVAARFLLACPAGHLDDFPYSHFVHEGGPCPETQFPTLFMDDHGGNQGANVSLRCGVCRAKRNIRAATGKNGEANLPRCRGRHPHLRIFEEGGCAAQPKVLVLGASNQWFALTLSTFSVPPTGASALEAEIERLWQYLEDVDSAAGLKIVLKFPATRQLADYPAETVLEAIEHHRKQVLGGPAAPTAYPDLATPEWEIFTAAPAPVPSEDFALRRDPGGVPAALRPYFSDIVQAERLREVRALVGFTRLDAPDPDDHELVKRAPLARAQLTGGAPSWIPASEVRGEGIFLRIDEELLRGWEARVQDSAEISIHFGAYTRFRTNRYSDRIPGTFDPERGWPGPRYIALHTLSHLLIRTIALECGYSAASLAERIYAGMPGDPRGGILIYTAVPDAEGTLGGLVSLAEPEALTRIVHRACRDATRCSSDPLCAERLPDGNADFLHGAACHVCLFVSETTCERGNRFLDRRFVVPIGDPALALLRNDEV